MKRMTKKNFMDSKTCKRNGLFHYKHYGLNECFPTELVSIVFSSSSFMKIGTPFKRG